MPGGSADYPHNLLYSTYEFENFFEYRQVSLPGLQRASHVLILARRTQIQRTKEASPLMTALLTRCCSRATTHRVAIPQT